MYYEARSDRGLNSTFAPVYRWCAAQCLALLEFVWADAGRGLHREFHRASSRLRIDAESNEDPQITSGLECPKFTGADQVLGIRMNQHGTLITAWHHRQQAGQCGQGQCQTESLSIVHDQVSTIQLTFRTVE